VIAPCTGNTLGKLANGIADSAVTFACKAHLRNGRPVLLAISTNDGLSASAENLGKLLNRKHYYFVPFSQDDPQGKPYSLVAHFPLLPQALKEALEGRQLSPLLQLQFSEK
jgi:dipicolinate synthase subunit B